MNLDDIKVGDWVVATFEGTDIIIVGELLKAEVPNLDCFKVRPMIVNGATKNLIGNQVELFSRKDTGIMVFSKEILYKVPRELAYNKLHLAIIGVPDVHNLYVLELPYREKYIPLSSPEEGA